MSEAAFVVASPRLRLREVDDGDAAFIVELLNTPGFLRYIGDRGVRDHAGALRYIAEGPRASYARHGFGLYLVELRATATPIGLCGLLRRETLDAPDIGFAFLPAYEGGGYAHEAAAAVLQYGRDTLGLHRVVAIVQTGNARSIRLLERLGLRYEGPVELPGHGGEGALYGAADRETAVRMATAAS